MLRSSLISINHDSHRQTVGNYTDLLLEVELIEEVPNTSLRRYRVADSSVVRELFELNSVGE